MRCLASLAAGCLLLAAVPSPAAPGGQASDAASRTVRARYLMGTVFRIEAPSAVDPEATAAALESALDEVGRQDKILSNWDSGSETSRLNAAAGRGRIPVSSGLLSAVTESLGWAAATGGVFDPTVEPLTRPFRGQAPARAPARPGESRPRWTAVEVDRERGTVALPPGSGLDFGGIGKGIALDEAAAVLRRLGVANALLDAGGQLLALGAPPGEPGWRVAVADPAQRERPRVVLLLKDASAATSGNSERPGEILDPATGRSVAGAGSATAIAARATDADALSTALFVMGARRGLDYARGRADLIALFLNPSREKAPVVANLPSDAESTLFLIQGPPDPHQDRRLRVEAR